MFKKGLGKLFLVFSLVFVSGLVFSGCKETKVGVSNIAFKEVESITMVVGQTYTPDVNVTPSYATDRDYVLTIEANPDVLKVDGKNIVALKEGVAQLKVTSSDNKYLTSIIAVRVLPSKIQLGEPSNLTFDGEKFSFGSVSGANGYIISINGQEFNLGNSTTFSLKQYQLETNSSAHDKILSAKVKAVGDERITIESRYSVFSPVLKISSVSDLRIEDNKVKFTKVANVQNYELVFTTDSQMVLSTNIDANNYLGDKIELDLSNYSEFVSGQYFLSLVCSNQGYSSSAKVISSEESRISFDVLAKPQNMVLSNYYLRWDSVIGATSYTLFNEQDVVLMANIEDTGFDLKSLSLTQGSHTYKLVANSNKNINVLSGINYSDVISVNILGIPRIVIKDKMISWEPVVGATSYNLIIKDISGEEKENVNLVSTSYSLAKYTTGEYVINVFSVGDNKTTLSSLGSASGEFAVLEEASNLRVEDKVIKWDSNVSGGKYNLKIFDSVSQEAYIDETLTSTQYNIAPYTFDAGEYRIYLETLGEDNVFNSKVVNSSFYKLSEIKNIKIEDCVVSFTIDAKTDNTNAVLYKKGDRNTTYSVLSQNGKNRYTIDSTNLDAGEYEIETYAYGNNTNVLDADNLAETRVLSIRKLGVAGMRVDKTNLNVARDGVVDYAESYSVYLNGEKKAEFSTTEDTRYDISGFESGEYEFTIQAIGNGKDILDGEINNGVKILKLDTPSISLDKTTLIYTIKTNESQDKYVASYDFSVNDISQPATSKTIDCNHLFVNSGVYKAKIRLIALEHGDYDFIMDSDQKEVGATKINSQSSLTFDAGKVIIDPTSIQDGDLSKYTPTVNIGFKEIGATDFTYVEYVDLTIETNAENAVYTFNIYDNNYNVSNILKADGAKIFENAGEYHFKVKYERSGYVASDEWDLGTITKLDKVVNIRKTSVENANNSIAPTESISFDAVNGVSKYLLRIVRSSNTYLVELEAGTTNVKISDLKDLFKDAGLTLSGNSNYNLEIIALGDDAQKVASSVASQAFVVKLLRWADLEISTNNILVISNYTQAEKAYITCKDASNTVYRKVLNLLGGQTTLSLSQISGLSSGEIKISVVLQSSDANIFQSSTRTIKYTQLDKVAISVEDGLIVWDVDENASKYVLSYLIDGESHSINLQDGVEYFKIVEDVNGSKKATYDLRGIGAGTNDITITKIGKGKVEELFYYDSVASDKIVITKLSQPTISTENGKIKIVINSTEFSNVSNLYINGEAISKYSTLAQTMTIDPTKLLNYNTETEIQEETFTVSLTAKTIEGQHILNADDINFNVKGLKAVSGINVKTTFDSTNAIVEVLDSIGWTPNPLNEGIVDGYLLTIEYKSESYQYFVDKDANSYTFPREEEFGAGNYNITIQTLTAKEGYVNSKNSETFVVNVCDKPKNIKTTDGVVEWNAVEGASEYLVKIYNKNNDLLQSCEVSTNKFDFNQLGCDVGIYKIYIYATNKFNNSVVTSEISDGIEVLRLPKITKFKVEMGDLYLYTHSLTSAIELTLTGSETYNYTVNLVAEKLSLAEVDWSQILGLDTLLTQSTDRENDVLIGWEYKKVEVENSGVLSSILNMLDAGYNLSVKALGNSTTVGAELTVAKLSTVNSLSTSSTNGLENVNATTPSVYKMKTPSAEISSRGVVTFGLPVSYIDCEYFNLKGLVVYDILLSASNIEYSFYGVDNYYDGVLDGVSGAEVHVYQSTENHTYYGYIKYQIETDKYLYINILRSKENESAEYSEQLKIDFKNNDFLYFVNKDGTQGEIEVKAGGNFDVSIRVVGDGIKYLTSNSTTTLSIIRYKQLVISIENGYLKWENLKIDGDDPIYLLQFNDLSSNSQVLLYVLQEDGSADINIDTSTLDRYEEGKTYFIKLDYSKAYIEYMLDTMINDHYLFASGEYRVNITTYYRDNTDISRLQSKASGDYEFLKLAQPQVSIERGDLKWKQVEFSNGSKVEKYQIQLSLKDSTEKMVYTITPDDYKVKSGYVYYTLPQSVDGIFTNLSSGSDNIYVINVVALAGENTESINSNNSEEMGFDIHEDVCNVNMVDGRLVWEHDLTEGTYKLLINIYDEDKKLITRANLDAFSKEYELGSSLTDINGQSISLTSEYYYEIFVKRVGDGDTLTGFYVGSGYIEKLKAIDDSTITSKEGVLTWESVKDVAGNVVDEIEFILGIKKDGATLPAENVIGTSFDFAGYEPGKYTITLTPTKSNYFDGLTSKEFVVYKLREIDIADISIVQDKEMNSNKLEWNAITITDDLGSTVYAEKYLIEIIDDDGVVQLRDSIEDNEKSEKVYYALGVELTNLKVRIKPVMISENGNVINGEWSEYKSYSKAESVVASTLKIVDEFKIEWGKTANEQSGDRYRLKYRYQDKNYVWYDKSVVISADGNDTYIYVPTEVGKYTNINVQVVRGSQLSSTPVYMQDEDGNNVSFEFNKFEDGAGTESNPYQIATIEHLGNIDIFPNAYYILNNDLSFKDSEYNGKMLISKEFGGNFNANGKTISYFTLTSAENMVGMFRCVNGATFSNLTISYTDVTITTNYSGERVYGGVVAGQITNSTFTNVKILSSVINVQGKDDGSYSDTTNTKFYYGGMAGYISNSTLNGCTASLGYEKTTSEIVYTELTYTGRGSDYVYYGGVAGYITNTTISGNGTDANDGANVYYKTAINGSDDPNIYFGGIVGAMEGSSISEYRINLLQHSESSGQISYNAGVCGYVVSGVDGDEFSSIYVGGKIGTVVSTGSTIYIGKLYASTDLSEGLGYSNISSDEIEIIKGNNVEETKITN